jgi:hypothetical protein
MRLCKKKKGGPPKQTALWKMKSGRQVRICDMSDQHLINSMSLLMRYASAALESHRKFYATCPPPQGEMAELLFDQECDYWDEAIITDCIPDIFWKMKEDAERRGMELELVYDAVRGAQPHVRVV